MLHDKMDAIALRSGTYDDQRARRQVPNSTLNDSLAQETVATVIDVEDDMGEHASFMVQVEEDEGTPADTALPRTSAPRYAGLTSCLWTTPRSRSQITAIP